MTWYVDITNDPRHRLFDEHEVLYRDDAWIYRTASSESEAQYVLESFLGYGLDGGKGPRRPNSSIVYAYRKSINTKL